MQVNFSRESWHRRFHGAIYDDKPAPENLCPYFWQVVLSLVTFPLILPGFLAGRFLSFDPMGAAFKYFFSGIFYFVNIFLWGIGHDGFGINNFVLAWMAGAGVLLAFLATIAAAAYLGRALTNLRKRDASESDETPLVSAKIYAWKNKVCPRINWK